ncbi:hypothetical protein [Mycobacterium sp. PS03-16]|uniref:hypothetical protein n=1 Tax=Mycobacterium sp. PS03-16 TaxID=2559611 RepID=UPI001FD750BA|nr:hypothetical protein [Mycobacterium sp. PS03-16]
MPDVKDPDGVRWRVHRRWMPLLDYLDMASWGTNWFGVVMFVLALPFLVAWPFWALGKLVGVPWKVVVTRDGDEVAEEKIKGWRDSGRRIAEIAHGIEVSGEIPAPGSSPQDLRPYR